MENALSRAEQRAVERHRCELSAQRGEEVAYEAALCDWMEHYSAAWRSRRHALALEKQREEINKHKWLLSEKACHDVGREAAMDWITNYAAQWRDWFENQEFEDASQFTRGHA